MSSRARGSSEKKRSDQGARPLFQSGNSHERPMPGDAPIRPIRPAPQVAEQALTPCEAGRLGRAALEPPYHGEVHRSPKGSLPPLPSAAGPGRTAAQGIVAALTLPACPPSSESLRPLPLIGLHRLPRDTSMLYDIGCIDASGRVTNRDIVSALRWQPGDKFEIILRPDVIVIRASSDGLYTIPHRSCIVIPATARRQHRIEPGDHVLLAAAPEYGVVIVHTRSALDDMLALYHSRIPSLKYEEHE